MRLPAHARPAVAMARRRAEQWRRATAAVMVAVPALGTVAAAVLVAMGRPPGRDVLLLAALTYLLVALGVTAGFHRLFAHRSFEAARWLRAWLGVLGSAACQGPLLFWVATHRRHHRFADREGDPHSPARDGLLHAHVGWILAAPAPDLARYVPDLIRDRLAWAIHRSYFVWVAAGVAVPAAVAGVLDRSWAAAGAGALWAGLVRTFVAHHVTWAVNSVCHRYGRRSHATSDASTNQWLVALLSLGEGWHNNHHAFPSSARHGLRATEPDPTYWAIRALAAAGAVRSIKTPRVRQEAEDER